MDGAARGQPGLVGVGGVLRNHKGKVLFIFSKHVGIKVSKEVEVLAILEALRIYSSHSYQNILVERESSNAIY